MEVRKRVLFLSEDASFFLVKWSLFGIFIEVTNVSRKHSAVWTHKMTEQNFLPFCWCSCLAAAAAFTISLSAARQQSKLKSQQR